MKKPKPSFGDALAFQNGAPTVAAPGRKPPPTDHRLTVNIEREAYMRFKIYATTNYTSMGELIEEWINLHIPRE